MSRKIITALVLASIVIGGTSSSMCSYAAEGVKADVVYQQYAPYWLNSAEESTIDGKVLAAFSCSLPENQCVVVISDRNEVKANANYEYIGFDKDIYYYVEK